MFLGDYIGFRVTIIPGLRSCQQPWKFNGSCDHYSGNACHERMRLYHNYTSEHGCCPVPSFTIAIITSSISVIFLVVSRQWRKGSL